MEPENLDQWVQAKPFVPFRIRLNSGRTYEIRHPEMIRIGRSIALIFSFGESPEFFERSEMVSLLLMESIEPLETPQTA